jgi:hypothetical protein
MRQAGRHAGPRGSDSPCGLSAPRHERRLRRPRACTLAGVITSPETTRDGPTAQSFRRHEKKHLPSSGAEKLLDGVSQDGRPTAALTGRACAASLGQGRVVVRQMRGDAVDNVRESCYGSAFAPGLGSDRPADAVQWCARLPVVSRPSSSTGRRPQGRYASKWSLILLWDIHFYVFQIVSPRSARRSHLGQAADGNGVARPVWRTGPTGQNACRSQSLTGADVTCLVTVVPDRYLSPYTP